MICLFHLHRQVGKPTDASESPKRKHMTFITCQKFEIKNSHIAISVGCDNNIKSNNTDIKCLEIMIDNTLMWKSHIETIIAKFIVAS
jgi:hypothetical protein